MNKEEKSVRMRGNPWPNALLLRGGRVIDPGQKLDSVGDVLLRDGRVAEVAPSGSLQDAVEVFDARGLVVAPGFIDLHVHLREPGQTYKESIATGTAAAAAGGFTSVCCMPNTSPVNDNPEITAWMQDPGRGAVVNVFPVAAATVGSKGERLTKFADLRNAGAVGVTDDGRPLLEESLMQEALRSSARVFPVFQHAEDTRLSAGGVMHEGPTAFRLGLRGIPANSESEIVERDIEMARNIRGSRLHVSHVSTAAAMAAVVRGKKAGVGVTCEVTPHHFTLIDEDVGDYDTRCKVNPPLRSREDREALLRALAEGAVDAIATDHAPHALHEKQVEFDRAPFGIAGLETALALAITRLHLERKVPLTRIVELLSTGPARVAGLEKRGTLVRGSHADLTIFDPKKRWTFDAVKSRSKSRNTPFDGWKLAGQVVGTIVGGAWVFRDV